MKKLLSIILVVALALSLFCVTPASAEVGSVELDETATNAISANPSIRLIKGVATYGNYIYVLQTRYYDNADAQAVGAYLKVYSVNQDTGALTDVTPENSDYDLAYKNGQAVHSLIEVIGDYLYVGVTDTSSNGSIKKFSLANPAAPALVAHYTGFASRTPLDFEVAGDYFYVGSLYQAWQFDNTATGTVAVTLTDHVCIGYNGQNTRAMAYDEKSGLIFANYGASSIKAYNAETGADTYTSERTDVNARQMIIDNGVLYVSSEGQNKVYAIDISNGANAIVSTANWKEVADVAGAILVEDGVLYVKTAADAPANTVLKAYKLGADGTTATLLDTASCAVGSKGYACTFVKCGNYLFTATNQELISVGLKVYEDISDVTVDYEEESEVFIPKTSSTKVMDYAVKGDYLYAWVIDITESVNKLVIYAKDALTGEYVATETTDEDYVVSGTGGTVANSMMIDGNYLYVTMSNSIIKKFDIGTNPAVPELKASFNTNQINKILKVGDNLFGTTRYGIYKWTDTASTTGTTAGTQVVGNNGMCYGLAYDATNGLVYAVKGSTDIVTISALGAKQDATIAGLSGLSDLAVDGGYLYINRSGSIYRAPLSADGVATLTEANWVKLYDGESTPATKFIIDGYILHVLSGTAQTLDAYRIEHNGALTHLDYSFLIEGTQQYVNNFNKVGNSFVFNDSQQIYKVDIEADDEVVVGTTFTATAEDGATLTSAEAKSGLAIWVAYDANGKMLDWSSASMSVIAGGTQTVPVPADFDATGATEVKVMLWADMINCVPLVDTVSY